MLPPNDPAAARLREAAVAWVENNTEYVPEGEAWFRDHVDRPLLAAAIALGHDAGVQDAVEAVLDNPYTSGPCANRIVEYMFRRGHDGRLFEQMEDALRDLVREAVSVPNRTKSFGKAIGAAGELLNEVERRRFRPRELIFVDGAWHIADKRLRRIAKKKKAKRGKR